MRRFYALELPHGEIASTLLIAALGAAALAGFWRSFPPPRLRTGRGGPRGIPIGLGFSATSTHSSLEFTADRFQAVADSAAALQASAGHGTVTGNLTAAALALLVLMLPLG